MARISVLKTYKLYINGKFPRTESGRYFQPEVNGEALGNICQASRKDFRNAVVAARSCSSWAKATAYNRGQILYRIAEMLEGRSTQFISELQIQGATKAQAEKEVTASIDRIIYYAGWCDKFTQFSSSVNPVAGNFFNFSSPEPTGVVSIFAPEANQTKDFGLLGFVTQIMPVIAGGNTCIILAAETHSLSAISFAEVLATSDVAAGVVNILTGKRDELVAFFSSHMDVDTFLYCGSTKDTLKKVQTLSQSNVKSVVVRDSDNWYNEAHENPYYIQDFVEIKTTWHPIENISASGSGY